MEPNPIFAACFSEIRQGFDPAFSYVVFENESVHGVADDFKDLTSIISDHQKEVLEQIFYRDRVTDRVLLVVKLDPAKADDIIAKIQSFRLPQNLAVYFYFRNTRL